ncbi:hypothetical protein IAT40_004537 [Kwoniella sp. CBS 6097]
MIEDAGYHTATPESLIKRYSIEFPLEDRDLKAWEEVLELAYVNHPERSSVQELNKFKQRFYGYQLASSASNTTATLLKFREEIKAEIKAEVLAELRR